MEQYIETYASPLGIITMGSNGKQLTGLWFEGQKYFDHPSGDRPQHHSFPIFDETRTWLDVYFQGKRPTFTPPILLNDTPFRRTVWQLLLTIPYGETTTYKDIAMKWARQHGVKSMSSQAVGGAVGRNPISIIIPCHRVMAPTEASRAMREGWTESGGCCNGNKKTLTNSSYLKTRNES